MRPGWTMPIHQLLVKYKVSAYTWSRPCVCASDQGWHHLSGTTAAQPWPWWCDRERG
jgi:hypothetical protein